MDNPEALVAGGASERANPRFTVPSARLLAWSLWIVAVVQVGFGVFLAVLNRLSFERVFAEYVVSQTMATLAFATAGLLVASRRPAHAIGWLFCITGVGMGLTAWPGQYARYALVTSPGSLPIADVVTWLFFWTWIPVVALAVIFLPLLFPTGRLPSARWRPLFWLGVAATVLLATDLAFSPGPLDASLPEVSNPFGVEGTTFILDVIHALALFLVLVSFGSAAAAPIVRYRRAQHDERQQLKWFAYATALVIMAYLIPPIKDPTGFADPESGSTLLSGILLSVTLPILPAATGIAVLRYRLYDIDPLINRTLVYGVLTGGIFAVYVFIVGYLGALFHTSSSLLVSLVATGTVAVLFAPLREWLQRGVNRLMYGERDEPYRAISRLRERLEEAIAPDDVLPTIVTTVREALKLPYAAIALPSDDAFVIAAETGSIASNPLRLPLVYQGEAIGELLVGPRAPNDGFSSADRRLLDDLAHHAGVAVHGVRTMMDLQRSRERLVLAREEERRRIRRDLHDELAPMLAALGLTAATVTELIATDPVKAVDVNAKLEAAIRTTVADVRRLVYDLRPPTLDELGLVEAIRERAAVYSAPNRAGSEREGADLEVTVDVPEPLPVLPAAVEVAAYRIVQEALTNVARHARARTCRVCLVCRDNALCVEVVDDGVGLQGKPRLGIGLRSMQDRIAELSGTWSIETARPSGTCMSFCVPIPTTLPVIEEGADEYVSNHDR